MVANMKEDSDLEKKKEEVNLFGKMVHFIPDSLKMGLCKDKEFTICLMDRSTKESLEKIKGTEEENMSLL